MKIDLKLIKINENWYSQLFKPSIFIGFRNQETTCIDKIDYIDFVDYRILSIGHTRNLKKGKNSYGETP